MEWPRGGGSRPPGAWLLPAATRGGPSTASHRTRRAAVKRPEPGRPEEGRTVPRIDCRCIADDRIIHVAVILTTRRRWKGSLKRRVVAVAVGVRDLPGARER